uniref:Uncharacterized protein n=1 Tax=Macrostomum lignano TaxID=282301 RepID=A0A1I8F270_9PLAT
LNSAELCIQIQTLGLSSRLSRTARNARRPVTEVAPGGPSAAPGSAAVTESRAINGTPLSRFSEEALRNLLENRPRESHRADACCHWRRLLLQKAEDASATEAELFPSDEERKPLPQMDSPLRSILRWRRRAAVTRRENDAAAASAVCPVLAFVVDVAPLAAAADLPAGAAIPVPQHQQLEQLRRLGRPGLWQSSPAKSSWPSPSASSVFGRLSGEDSSLSMSRPPSPQTPLVGMRQRASATGSAIGSASPCLCFCSPTVP